MPGPLTRIESRPGGAAILGLAVGCALLAAYALWLELWGGSWGRVGGQGSGANLALILLISFLVPAMRRVGRHDRADLQALRPLTSLDAAAMDRLLDSARAARPVRTAVYTASGAVLGMVVVLLTQRSPIPAQWSPELAWAMGLNASLFALMAWGLEGDAARRRAVALASGAIERIDLLDLARLAPLSRIGLRHAFLWAGGSAIASLILIDIEVRWPVAVVITATVTVATLAFLGPVRAVHRRIREARRAELTRVRGRLHALRGAALDQADAEASAALEGLLAWESRIAAVSEWPFDVPTLARFGALVSLAVGSWLGGAVVERALGVLLGE